MDLLPRQLCRTCRHRLLTPPSARSFTTTPSHASIPPESPHYISIPASHQPDSPRPRAVKGTLPVPREIFPRNKPHKSTEAYRLAATPEPSSRPNTATLSERQRYKLKMADLRRRHLREGLQELHDRKQTTERIRREQSDMRQNDRQRLARQPEREDARLTNVSVPQAMRVDAKQHFSADEAQAIHRVKAANHARHVEKRERQRLDSLHTLYMHARTFIVDEAQWNRKIDEEFAEGRFTGRRQSLWDTQGPPEGIAQMLKGQFVDGSGQPRGELEALGDVFKRDQARMKRLAEKLSGGKI